MKVLISGSYGLVGSASGRNLTSENHSITRLVRSTSQEGILWNPLQSFSDTAPLEGFDAVVHLAGESISEGRWNQARKNEIRVSRVEGTKNLCEALAKLSEPPRVLITASASGYYGDRGSEILTEESPAGDKGFLTEVCQEWEQATVAAAQKGIRVVNLRFGIILSKDGGALKKMLPPFRFGVGGKIGSGEQYWSWIDIDDIAGIISFCLNHESLQGPVNAVSPNPVSNAEFTKTLAHVLCRPAIFPMPAFAARVALGEMADDLLLAGARMHPAKLIAAGYTFRYPDLESSLRHLL